MDGFGIACKNGLFDWTDVQNPVNGRSCSGCSSSNNFHFGHIDNPIPRDANVEMQIEETYKENKVGRFNSSHYDYPDRATNLSTKSIWQKKSITYTVFFIHSLKLFILSKDNSRLGVLTEKKIKTLHVFFSFCY